MCNSITTLRERVRAGCRRCVSRAAVTAHRSVRVCYAHAFRNALLAAAVALSSQQHARVVAHSSNAIGASSFVAAASIGGCRCANKRAQTNTTLRSFSSTINALDTSSLRVFLRVNTSRSSHQVIKLLYSALCAHHCHKCKDEVQLVNRIYCMSLAGLCTT